LAYPQRVFHFSEVDPFEGPGSGLGLSILSCRDHLQQPFVFASCDTLVQEAVPAPVNNWMGWAPRDDHHSYRTLRLKSSRVTEILEKGESDNQCKPYIGLAGIADHELFWKAMEDGGSTAVDQGEAFGLREILAQGNTIKEHEFTWFDTGNPNGLKKADAFYSTPGGPNVLNKPDEAIWFVGDDVIKFSTSTSFIADRVKRASTLKGFVPEVTGASEHMYRYRKVMGDVMSEVVDIPLFKKMLAFCRTFWTPVDQTADEKSAFEKDCMTFYRDKTVQRIQQFYTTFNLKDGELPINGTTMPFLSTLLDNVDWDWLARGSACRFHGDFHFENILWSPEDERFVFLDWRQNFGGSLHQGDVYYDFAKLQHGLIINHGLINHGQFDVTWDPTKGIRYDFLRRQSLVQCQEVFEAWLVDHGYDLPKVRLLTALIYLNIAALHHEPYNLLLYALGKSMLHEELEKLHGR
jgi:hypothetical protein